MLSHSPTSLCVTVRPSPNHNERRAPIDMLLLHYTGMASCEAAIERLCDPTSDVSCHYVVTENGNVLRLVGEERRSWHAGQGHWQGVGDINSRSIGIEICNRGHDYGLPPFPRRQIAAVIALCRDILSRHPIPAHHVLAHSDIAPGRKRDPGERFPWQALARQGIGHWVRPSRVKAGATLHAGNYGPAVEELQQKLARYGYPIAISGRYDLETQQAVIAFQRHFCPKMCDGQARPAMRATLDRLLLTLR